MRAPPAPAPADEHRAASDLLYLLRVSSFTSIAEYVASAGRRPQGIGESIADAVGRAHADNSAWHIYTRVLDARALRAVAALHDRPQAPLLGVPVALKDNIDIAGEITSCGRRRRSGLARSSAAIVQQLDALGAVIIGKTNLDEAALGASGRNARFGRCHNPQHHDRLSGGSSGGSAAAVAAGHALLGVGTDTLGSVRIPAAFCGIVGFKPTHGRLPTEGIAPLYPRFDSVGLLAGSLADVVLLAEALLGPDAQDRTPGGSPRGILHLRVLDEGALTGVAVDVAGAYRRCADLLRLSGQCRGGPAPRIDWSANARAALWEVAHEFAERSAGGIPDYHALDDIDGELGLLLARAAALPAARLAAGRALLAETTVMLRQSLHDADAVLTPTCPQNAPRSDETLAKNVAAFVAPANLAGLPAVSWPQRLGPGHSLSLQLIGRWGEDLRLLAAASQVQRLLDRAPGVRPDGA
jgi:aspartyl-tRNA(Asn)/glutamyl-tRNA(Gln) amidotransferase subunit A